MGNPSQQLTINYHHSMTAPTPLWFYPWSFNFPRDTSGKAGGWGESEGISPFIFLPLHLNPLWPSNMCYPSPLQYKVQLEHLQCLCNTDPCWQGFTELSKGRQLCLLLPSRPTGTQLLLLGHNGLDRTVSSTVLSTWPPLAIHHWQERINCEYILDQSQA